MQRRGSTDIEPAFLFSAKELKQKCAKYLATEARGEQNSWKCINRLSNGVATSQKIIIKL